MPGVQSDRNPYERVSTVSGNDGELRVLSYYYNDFPLRTGVPMNLPCRDELVLVLDFVGPCKKPFQRSIKWAGVEYCLLLEYNENNEECKENIALKKLYHAIDKLDFESIADAKTQCMELFWPFLEKRNKKHAKEEHDSHSTAKKSFARTKSSSVNMQLKSVDGVMQVFNHDKVISKYGLVAMDLIPDLPTFEESEVEEVKKIHDFVSIVKADGKEFCLKRVRWMAEDGFKIEFSKLQKVGSHPNVMTLSGVVKHDDKNVQGFLMPKISGTELAKVQSAPKWIREQWKEKISAVIQYLHGCNVVWGDAKPENIMIDDRNHEPVLFDFEGGITREYVPEELSGTKHGDIHALEIICSFIDKLPTA